MAAAAGDVVAACQRHTAIADALRHLQLRPGVEARAERHLHRQRAVVRHDHELSGGGGVRHALGGALQRHAGEQSLPVLRQ